MKLRTKRSLWVFCITEGPDGMNRYRFTIHWEEPDGVYRAEKSKDGTPVGYRRGQCFHANLEFYLRTAKAKGRRIEIRDERQKKDPPLSILY